MTRIGYLVSQYPAPSHTFIRREIAALRKRGLTILPFSVRPGSGPADETVPCVLGGSRTRAFAAAASAAMARPRRAWRTWRLAQRHREPGLRGFVWAQFHFAEALILASMLRRAGVGRLHSHFGNSGATVGMLAASMLGIPWSLTLHGISETDGAAGRLLPDKLARADFVGCASWFMKAQGMRAVPPATWTKFVVVRCGLDLSQTPFTAKAEATRPLRFVAVGRVSAEKGYPGLIDAFSRVVANGVEARLSIVGDGPLKAELAGQVRALGLSPQVQMLGALPERETLAEIARADVLVLASLMEGLPVVLMEAMALGTPVIAPAVAGIPELVADGVNGLLYRAADWRQLGEHMQRLATDVRLRRHLAATARERIEGEFDVDNAVRPLAGLLTGSTPVPSGGTGR